MREGMAFLYLHEAGNVSLFFLSAAEQPPYLPLYRVKVAAGEQGDEAVDFIDLLVPPLPFQQQVDQPKRFRMARAGFPATMV